MNLANHTYCRLCADLTPNEDTIHLRNNDTKCSEVTEKLKRINTFTNFNDDVLPKTVCLACAYSLDTAYEFVLKIEQAQHKLRSIFLFQSFKSEMNEDQLLISLERQDSVEGYELIESTPDLLITEEDTKKLYNIKEEFNLKPGDNITHKLPSDVTLKKESILEKMLQNPTSKTKEQQQQNEANELNQHIIQPISGQQGSCNAWGQTFNDNLELAENKNLINSPKKSISKRVSNKKTKKKETKTKPKGKVKRAEAMTTEDLNCNICGKHFIALPNLTRHMKTHDQTRPRNFTCRVCGRAFLTATTLKYHALTHSNVKTEVCQVCNMGFYSKNRLKAHIVTHSELRPFLCNECGNSFKTKRRLKSHLMSHSDVKPFSCMYCKKEFKFKANWKTHLHQHTGARPYRCEVCERTFTNWTNCNKHMLRKHNITLAHTKITSQGRIAIDRKTGEVSTLASDRSTMEWLDKMMQSERPGKTTSEEKHEKI